MIAILQHAQTIEDRTKSIDSAAAVSGTWLKHTNQDLLELRQTQDAGAASAPHDLSNLRERWRLAALPILERQIHSCGSSLHRVVRGYCYQVNNRKAFRALLLNIVISSF